ncbi:MAG: hypothetical protein QNL62_14350 [Gammaproteobacteria bacterium]|nr:hypothetical protein [Gammaproteobacteria bacterium]
MCCKKTLYYKLIFLLSHLFFSFVVFADGVFIDKVYHPYVQPHEKEVEWRWNTEKDNDDRLKDNAHQHRFAYGQSINEQWFAEFYLVGTKNREQEFKITAVELEALWQITEQGEYAADWGMLFELEREWEENISEASSALLIEKEWNKWVGTANLYLIYEWGRGVDNEIETAMALQGRYRYSRAIEPAIEFYSSDSSEGIGPVLLGNIRLGGKKQLRWEAGVIFALDNETADETLKFLLELEF